MKRWIFTLKPKHKLLGCAGPHSGTRSSSKQGSHVYWVILVRGCEVQQAAASYSHLSPEGHLLSWRSTQVCKQLMTPIWHCCNRCVVAVLGNPVHGSWKWGFAVGWWFGPPLWIRAVLVHQLILDQMGILRGWRLHPRLGLGVVFLSHSKYFWGCHGALSDAGGSLLAVAHERALWKLFLCVRG